MRLLILLFTLVGLAAPGFAQTKLKLEPPGEREFILDRADLIKPEDETKIRELCDKLLTDKATPIIVVTIESMALYGGAGMSIEQFAYTLFNQWGVGHLKLNGQDWNTGMLLLVSSTDRKARIEFGAGLAHDYDMQALDIMDNLIIPNFKQEKFSEGIVKGVEGLDAIARGLEVPQRPTPAWVYVVIVVGIGLMIFTVVSLIRRGSSGWAWLFWGAVFALVAFLVMAALTNRGGSGGGFSGGSFGGGFSGGGGASGSW
ncbi:MAG: TPM domain-containing protein [Planctomycetes bacterium]|nr:TPM domain-containing protein [Planctomycetota bacterium]MCA8935602.1 TPM domain-containing protein [Planctomycetota bacterium]